MSEQAVIVYFQYGQTDLDPLFELEGALEAAINAAGVGECDGNEIAVDGSDGSLYMYGLDADELFNVVKPILEGAPFMQGAVACLRYGPPEDGVKKVRVKLGS